MELFLAQNHSAMTHLPIASSILAAVAAVAGLFVARKEVVFLWACLSIAAFVTVLPTVVTGIAAARGRTNDEGQAYIEGGLLVKDVPANTRIFRHELLGLSGASLAAILAAVAVARLRGRNVNRSLIALLSVVLAVLWGIGGHLGGEELWGPETFPAFHQSRTESGASPGVSLYLAPPSQGGATGCSQVTSRANTQTSFSGSAGRC